jgi:CheY-like chemotaxis protein
LGLLAEIQQTHKKSLPLVSIGCENEPEFEGSPPFAAQLPLSFTSSQLNNVLAGVFSTVQSATAEASPPQPGDTMAEQHPLRILLAEDNRVNQKVATRLLEKLGYKVEVVGNGRAAIEALEKQPFDVILMDIQMPEMDGLEAAATIRSQWPLQQQPTIIAMTAHALEGDREHYLAQGMDNYVSKPIQIDKLVEVLYQCSPVT